MAGLLFLVTGADQEKADDLFVQALPTLKKYGMPVGLSTVVALESASVIDENGNQPATVRNATFYFPCFDAIREKEGAAEGLANELRTVLGMPCHTVIAPVLAAF